MGLLSYTSIFLNFLYKQRRKNLSVFDISQMIGSHLFTQLVNIIKVHSLIWTVIKVFRVDVSSQTLVLRMFSYLYFDHILSQGGQFESITKFHSERLVMSHVTPFTKQKSYLVVLFLSTWKVQVFFRFYIRKSLGYVIFMFITYLQNLQSLLRKS